MGQKSNPNSFQKSSSILLKSGDGLNILEYSTLLEERLSILSTITTFFEKRRCLIKNCVISSNNEKSFLTILISFLVLKRSLKRKLSKTKYLKTQTANNFIFAHKFLAVLNRFGYSSSKRLILQNLNKIALKNQKTIFRTNHNTIKKNLGMFKKELYFETGLMLICLIQTTNRMSFLTGKFIAYFFKMFHRSKKINKFLLFITKFVEYANQRLIFNNKDINIKGLKIQIKGRFKGAPRTQTRIFSKGSIPLQTTKANINYSLTHVHTSYGVFSIKIWICEIL